MTQEEFQQQLEATVAAAVAAEREACARICDAIAAAWAETAPKNWYVATPVDGAEECAAAIRARG